MKKENRIKITTVAIVVCLLVAVYSRSREHGKALSRPASIQSAKPKPESVAHQGYARFELSDTQRAAVDRALDLHRPPSTQGEFEYLLLNPSQNRLKLTTEQIRGLQDAYDHLREARLAYEASIATVTVAEDKSVKIDIPAYPDWGASIEQSFRNELTARVGSDAGNAIVAEYGAYIAARNADFGRQLQSYLVTADTSNPGYVKVVLSWSQLDGLSGSTVSQVNQGSYYFFGALSAFFPEYK